ncbi:MAG: cobalamin biosynthesis protein CobD [Desulfobulbaceae bacterium]|nr:cobalamin biosynthesis protein CobD [Desulfobulbaceae bacterium]
MIYFLQLLASILLDALIGDPRWYPHPVRGIGKLCSWSETITRSMISNLYLAGALTVIAVIGSTGLAVSLILLVAVSFSSTVEGIVAVILLYTTIAAKDLLRHSNEVYLELTENVSLENARIAVGKIVGRDTSKLNEDGICRATIETVAENMVDGITAPLFFAILASCFAPVVNVSPISCSVIGAFLYKAVNTMDSMIAYKNERYLKFGRVAAKLDDVVNFFPARISGFCLIIAAFFLKLDYRTAAKVFLRDRLKHSSPNAGHTEATAAGALGVRLGGPSFYFDKIVEKPFIGDSDSDPMPADIKKTNHLVIVGSLVFFVMLVGMRMLLI